MVGLVSWYEHSKRQLPWRCVKDPYPIWVSEIMLQQTKVDTVIPYYTFFIAAYPTVFELASAAESDVLKLWEGLGYYSRARNLHRAARYVVEELSGDIPKTFDELKALPGVGDYTAAAIASIAFSQPVPAIDGNCLRVLSRFLGLEDEVTSLRVRKIIHRYLSSSITSYDPSQFNQSIMELGALVCLPKAPQCDRCPLSSRCVAKERNLTAQIPRRRARSRIFTRVFGAAFVYSGERFLICRRENNSMLGGLWMLPGGEIDEAKEMNEQISAIIKQKLSISVSIHNRGSDVCITQTYSHFKMILHIYMCQIKRTEGTYLSLGDREDVEFITRVEMSRYPFDKATLRALDIIENGHKAHDR